MRINTLKYLFISILLIPTFCFAQNKMRYQQKRPQTSQNLFKGLPNLQNYDNKLVHFGFLIGYNSFNFTIKPQSDLSKTDSIMSVTTTPLSGFDLAIVSDLRMGEYLNLRFIPGLSFGDRNIQYSVNYGDTSKITTDKRIETIYLNLPLFIKLKSSRMHNVRIYALGGIQYTFDLISNEKKQTQNKAQDIVKIQRHDVQAIAGFGFDFYMERFKFSTEFKMSFGLRDILVREANPYANSIKSLNSQVIMISFLFE